MKTAIFIFLNLISLVSLSQGRPGKFTITGSIFVSKYSFPEADTGSIILYVGRSFPDKVYNEAEKITVPLDKNYQFKCSIESVQFATWFSIQLPEYAKQTSRGYYYIEPGDSINLLITSTSEKKIKYDFTGKGAEKYVYKFQSDYLVSQYENTPGAGLIELRQRKPENTAALRYQFANSSRCTYEFRLAILNQYKKLLSPFMYRLYEGEVINFFRTSVCSDIYLSYPNLNPNQATMDSIRNLLASVPKLDFGKHANIYANSPKIIHELRRYVLPTELLLTKKGIHPKTPTKNEIFSAILQNYSSTLRENLLYYFLKSYVTISDAEEYRKFLNEAYSLTKHPEIRSRYELLIQANGINKPIYDYAFTDINGGKISLSSFKGKVVFLDYWYTGCIPCVRLAKLIEEKVRPDLPDEDIVFVSINGDKERNEWINSVKSGIYGPKDGINLFTDGLLFDHPFVRYYGFVGAPTMMIIDRNSRVLYKNVPHDPEVIKKYLHDALTQE